MTERETQIKTLCEELTKHYGWNVKHERQEIEEIGDPTYRDTFYYGKKKQDMNGNPYMQKNTICYGDKLAVEINAYLPPRLIVLIGMFYESEATL